MVKIWIGDALRQLVLAGADAASQWFAGGERIMETAVLLVLLWITINRKDLSANRAYRRKAVVNVAKALIRGKNSAAANGSAAATPLPASISNSSTSNVGAPNNTAHLTTSDGEDASVPSVPATPDEITPTAPADGGAIGFVATPALAAARAVSAMQQMLSNGISIDVQEAGGGLIPRGLSVPKLPTAASLSAAAVAAYSTTSSLLRRASSTASSSLNKEEFNRGLRSLSMTVTGASARMRAVMQEVSETTRIAGATLASSNAYYYNPLRPRARRVGEGVSGELTNVHDDYLGSSSDGDSDDDDNGDDDGEGRVSEAAGWASYLAESSDAAPGVRSAGGAPRHPLAKLLQHIDIAAQMMDMMDCVDIFSLSLASAETLSALSNDYAWERLWMLRYGALWKSPTIRTIRHNRGVVWDPFHNWGPPQQGWKTFFVEFEYGWADWLLAGRNTRASCLIALGNLVLDATAFVPSHPGSSETLLDHAGGDCTVLVREMGHSRFAYRAMQHFVVFDGRKRSVDSSSYSSARVLEVEEALRRRRLARAPPPGTVVAPAVAQDAEPGVGGGEAVNETQMNGGGEVAPAVNNDYLLDDDDEGGEEGAAEFPSSSSSLQEYTSAHLARPMCKLEVRLLLERLAVLRLCESDHRFFLRIVKCTLPKDAQGLPSNAKICTLVPYVLGTGIVGDRLAFSSRSVPQKYPLGRISGGGSAAEQEGEAVEVALIRAPRSSTHHGHKEPTEWVIVSDRVGESVGSTLASATYNCSDFSSGDVWLHAAAAAEDPLPAAAADLLTAQKDANAGPCVTCFIDGTSAPIAAMLRNEDDEELNYWRERSVAHLGRPRAFYDPLAQEWRVWWSCCGVKYTMDQQIIDKQCEK